MQLLAGFRSGAYLTRPRLIAWASILIVIEAITALFFVAGTHGWIVPLSRPTTTDFASFYAAGTLALSGHPQDAYDPARLYAAEQAATAIGIDEQKFFYPPTFLILCSLLAHLPYLAGFAALELLSALAFFLVMIRLANESSGLVPLLLLAYPATVWTAAIGQNSFLSAALFALGTMMLPRRPWLAGAVLGLLCFKPHLGLLLPVAFMAGRHWKALLGAGLSTALVTLLSVMLFGLRSWSAFLVAFHRAGHTFQTGVIPHSGLISIYAAGRVFGFSQSAANLLQLAASLAAAAAVAFVWSGRAPDAVKAAALIAGTILAVPVLLFYDLLIAAVAAAWLIQDGLRRGFRDYELSFLVFGFMVPLLARPVAAGLHVPLGPLLPAGLLLICVMRAVPMHLPERLATESAPLLLAVNGSETWARQGGDRTRGVRATHRGRWLW